MSAVSTVAERTPSCLSQSGPKRLDQETLATIIGDYFVERFADKERFCFGPCPGLEVWSGCNGCTRFERCMVIDGSLNRWKQIQEDIVTLAELYEFDEHEQYAIRMSLEEAIINAVEHGNDGDPTKRIHIDYTVNSEIVRVRMADEGLGFDPDSVPDPTLPENLVRPGGRGLMFMRHYMSGVRYNERGNCVEMWKRKSEPACAS